VRRVVVELVHEQLNGHRPAPAEASLVAVVLPEEAPNAATLSRDRR
jgi:hypothetical protein